MHIQEILIVTLGWCCEDFLINVHIYLFLFYLITQRISGYFEIVKLCGLIYYLKFGPFS